MLPVARLSDTFQCGDIIAAGSGNVFVNNMPMARLSDMSMGHGPFIPLPITSGSGSVFVNFLPIAHITDLHPPHCAPNVGCHPAFIAVGSGNVFAG
jgi:uncharacterized Zn-binding protein involved in type VI secretion